MNYFRFKLIIIVLCSHLTTIYSQQDGGPCNSRWSKSNAMAYNTGQDEVRVWYAIQMNMCDKNGLCGTPMIWLWHDAPGIASIELSLKGQNSDGEIIVRSFPSTDLPPNEFDKGQGNWHLFCKYIGVEACSIRYKKGDDIFVIKAVFDGQAGGIYTFSKNGSKVLANGKTEKEVQDETKKKEDVKKIDNKYNVLVQEGDQLQKDGKFDEASAKYAEAKEIKPESSALIDEKMNAIKQNKNKEVQQQKKQEEQAVAKKQTEQKEAKEKEILNQQIAQENAVREQNQKEFDAQKQKVVDRQIEEKAKNEQFNAANTALVVLWIGFYTLPSPPVSNYNYKGMYFSLGPYNTFQTAPVYNNTYGLYTYNKNAGFPFELEGKGSSTITKVPTINFGIKTEFGYLSDALHLTFPLRASYGNLGLRIYNFTGTAGTNIFIGSSNWNRVKFGICYEYHYNSLNRSAENSTIGDQWTYESVSIANAKMGIASLKMGVRFQNNFNSKTINTTAPFVFDLFFTMNYVNELDSRRGHNSYIHPMAPGFELNLSKLGKFGFFAKVFMMTPVGKVEYYGSKDVVNIYGKNKETIEATNFLIGKETKPFFEIGVKREYCWFKKHK
ncbi:MAG: hypothetical protein IPI93_09190 [Sphingobacteriaceae bacterium]|nr:hypothetical protein [Sphingobacteriaceae bacterium]